jgi:hypothetical protein
MAVARALRIARDFDRDGTAAIDSRVMDWCRGATPIHHGCLVVACAIDEQRHSRPVAAAGHAPCAPLHGGESGDSVHLPADMAGNCTEVPAGRRPAAVADWTRGSTLPRAVRARAFGGYGSPAVSRWVERYRDGQCREVWTGMTSLGADLRSDDDSLAAATQVARETMRRARRNVERLIERLPSAGYEFEAEPLARPAGRRSSATRCARKGDRALATRAADLVRRSRSRWRLTICTRPTSAAG